MHKLITIGTPHQGTLLATSLANNPNQQNAGGVLDGIICARKNINPCTLGGVFVSNGNTVSTGVRSLEPNSMQLQELSPTSTFSAIVGEAPTNLISTTELVLDNIIGGFLPGQSVATILAQVNDTIVPVYSQGPCLQGLTQTCTAATGQADTATVNGVVHASLCQGWSFIGVSLCPDTGETQSAAFWAQAYWWLTGGTGTAPAPTNISSASSKALPRTAAMPAPGLNLTGYTQVAASNVTFLPTTGSILTINSSTNVITTSSTKTITEVLLLQTVKDPTDTALLYSTQSPFTISFTPTRLGTANSAAIAVLATTHTRRRR